MADKVTAQELRNKRIVAAARMIARFLLVDMNDRQQQPLYALNLTADLTEDERIALAMLLLGTFPADRAEAVAKMHFEGVGFPGATIMEDPMEDAKYWAEMANAKELGAYAAACFLKMTPARRQGFLKWAASK